MCKAGKLKKIADQIAKCKKCALRKTATNSVPGDGNPDSEIMFIGEAPGFYEDQQGLPFVGRAGKLLEFMLGQIGYRREDVYIANIIKHRPPQNRDPTVEEIKACQTYLRRQIDTLSPKLIVTLGRFAMNYFLPSAKISNDHGKPYKLHKYIVYPVYHPAAGLRNPRVKASLIKDFLKIPEILNMNQKELTPTKGVPQSKEEKSQQTKLF